MATGRSMAEAKVVKKLSPEGGKVVCTRAEVPELKVVKLSPSEEETRRLYTELLTEMKKLSPGTGQAEVCNKVEPEWKLLSNFSASEERPSMFSREKPCSAADDVRLYSKFHHPCFLCWPSILS